MLGVTVAAVALLLKRANVAARRRGVCRVLFHTGVVCAKVFGRKARCVCLKEDI